MGEELTELGSGAADPGQAYPS